MTNKERVKQKINTLLCSFHDEITLQNVLLALCTTMNTHGYRMVLAKMNSYLEVSQNILTVELTELDERHAQYDLTKSFDEQKEEVYQFLSDVLQ